jgi:hypothetical protein
MNTKLDYLLNDAVPNDTGKENPATRNPLAQVYITQGALQKAYTYAWLVCDTYQESLECYGYLISPKAMRDRIVRDLFIPRQVASGADVQILGEDVIRAGHAIDRLGYKVIGWWHSHANFETFHSNTDADNMMNILNKIAPINYITVYKRIPLFDGKLTAKKKGDTFELSNTHHPGKTIIFDTHGASLEKKELEKLTQVSLRTPVRIGFAYSIVVNALGDKPYTEIATKDFCGMCSSGEDESRETRCKIVKEKVTPLDELEISKEIKKKIKRPGFFYFGNSNTNGGFGGENLSKTDLEQRIIT